jgi:hypothetical protein
MSTALAAPPTEPALDVRTFLLGDDGPAALRDALRDAVDREAAEAPDGERPRTTKVLRRVAADQLAETAAGFLDVDLGAVVVAGWRKHRQLREAAQQTAADPGLRVIVELAEHRVTARWRPRVEVVLGPTTLAHLEFELAVGLRLAGLHAGVSGGRLTELAGGTGDLQATFSLGGQTLAERKAPFDASATVPLGRGVPLLGPPDQRTTPSVVEESATPEPAAPATGATADRTV